MSKDKDSNSGSLSLRHILQKHEEQLMDFSKNICLLCKRVFRNSDQINRHRSMSRLHTSRLKKLRQRLFSDEQLDRLERQEREASYRDRAKERRMKYHQVDRIVQIEQSHFNPTESMQTGHNSIDRCAKPLGSDNKGAALLSKMGWREGTGLGKGNDGIKESIKLDAQVGTSGLGFKSYKMDPNLSYKEAVQKIMYQRYNELSSDEEVT